MKYSRWLVLVFPVLVCGLLVYPVRQAQEAARQSACQGHMNQLQVALQTYESVNGHYPPASISGPDGTPWHSWRVLVLPYFGYQEVYDAYRFDEPWDGPNNRKLADKIFVELFQCPSGRQEGRTYNTNYVAVTGDKTAFPLHGTVALSDIKDGAANTILLVKIGNSDIHWMEPRDLPFDSLMFEPDASKSSANSVSSHHPSGPAVVFADRITAYRLRAPFSRTTLQSLLTIAGEEKVAKDSLVKSDPNKGRYLSEATE